ncbi:MAG: coniferyl aldehyde dehydrogenase [Desulfobacterales bacterium]|jgi:coniferyl-aldehyde dehydrogenase
MAQAAPVIPLNKPRPARDVFERQFAASRQGPPLSLEARRDILQKLESVLIAHQDAIAEAISKDFGNRSIHETKILELFPAIDGLRYTRRRLKKWVRPRNRHVGLWFKGARNRVIPQPKGVVGIIAPWNYPLFLVVSPLTSALAAGNRCMIKMAANAQGLCRLMHAILRPVFPEDLLAILPGVSAGDFTPLPFDHLVFTGSPSSGRTVMKTAGDNLTPVTLELGGKSPTLVAEDFDVQTAAERILHVKSVNAGQTCVSPDYLLMPAPRVAEFTAAARRIVAHRYPHLETPDYTSIIDDRSYRRLLAVLDDARAKGATTVNLIEGAAPDPVRRKIPPTILLNVNAQMEVMQQEIFGPLLPIKTYQHLDEAIAYINAHERPLALYLFSNDRRVQETVLARTMSGGVSINDCAMHVAQHDMPFGGIGNSGMGQYHGYEGFAEFSKLRPVFKQAARPLGAAFLYPPYGKTFERMYQFIIKMRWV